MYNGVRGVVLKSKIFDKIKFSKPFQKLDVLVYFCVGIAILVLFCVFVFFPKEKTSLGFEVYSDNQLILSHGYGSNGFDISDEYLGEIKIEKINGGHVITITYLDKVNVIFSDDANKRVSVTESNCSTTPDCKYMPHVSDSGVIICVPNGLKIQPLGSGGFTPPTTG